MQVNVAPVMQRPRRSALKSILWPSLVLFVLGLWLTKTLLPHAYTHLRAAAQDNLAQALVGTTFADSRWAHSCLANYAELDRYHAANQSLPPSTPVRVVFYGDSITEFWATTYPAHFFPGPDFLDRGVSGQSTRQMVWRFQQDVLDLHPTTVVILAGTNDVILRSRQITYRQTTVNIQAMVQAAKRQGIHVILCSVLPISRSDKLDEAAYTEQIRALNAWLRSYAAAQRITYLDYFTALATQDGTLDPSFSNDGTHPNAAGYGLMHSLAQQALDSGR